MLNELTLAQKFHSGISLAEILAQVHKEVCKKMFTTILFAIVSNGYSLNIH